MIRYRNFIFERTGDKEITLLKEYSSNTKREFGTGKVIQLEEPIIKTKTIGYYGNLYHAMQGALNEYSRDVVDEYELLEVAIKKFNEFHDELKTFFNNIGDKFE